MFKADVFKYSNIYLLHFCRPKVKIFKNVTRCFCNFTTRLSTSSRHNRNGKTNNGSIRQLSLRSSSSSSSFSTASSFSSSPSSSSFSSSSSSSSFENDDLSDRLFDLISENDYVSCSELIRRLSACGLWHNDPRLDRFYVRLENRKKTTLSLMPTFQESDRLTRETFKWLIEGSEVLFQKSLCDDFVIPDFSLFCKVLNEIYRDCRTNWEGVSSSWPHQEHKATSSFNFAGSGSDYWGVSVCTVDGQRHNMGDVDVYFPLHSCSWPFNYSFAMKQFGSDEVHRFVGSNAPHFLPSAIHSTLSSTSLSSMNPLSLSGSLLISSLLYKNLPTIDKRFDKLLTGYEKLVGDDEEGRVRLNEEFYETARKGSHHMKSLAHSLAGFNCFPRGTCCDEALDIHMKTSCLEVDVRTLALMAAYFANGGRCPLSMESPALIPSAVSSNPKVNHQHLTMTRNTLTFMHSSSSFSRSIHLPVMTSLTGAIILVVNGVLGMCLWSPPLAEGGISARGAQFCRDVVKRFNLQHLEVMNLGVKIDPRIRRSFNTAGHIGELLFAAHRGDTSSLHILHKSGYNMGSRDYDGRTALHVSCAEGMLDCVRYLVDVCHVDLEPSDRWGHRPLNEAIKFKRSKVEEFLMDRLNSSMGRRVYSDYDKNE